MIVPWGRHRVWTWDPERRDFCAQPGAPESVLHLAGIKAAFRALRELGYECHRGDPSVWVERIMEPRPRKRSKRCAKVAQKGEA